MTIIHRYRTERRIANFSKSCFTGFNRIMSNRGYIIHPYVEVLINHIKRK